MKKTEIRLIDDLDGGPADETIGFRFENQGYEIDLSAENAERLRAELERYVRAGRKVNRAQRGPDKKPRRHSSQ